MCYFKTDPIIIYGDHLKLLMQTHQSLWQKAVQVTKSGVIDDCLELFAHLSSEQFITDLNYLECLFPDFKDPYSLFLLNYEITSVGKVIGAPFEERLKQSIIHIHNTAAMLQAISHYSGFKKFIKSFSSDIGFFNQLNATVYLQQFIKIIDIEVERDGQDIDIIAEIEEESLYVHVKSINQAEKQSAQFRMTYEINEWMYKLKVLNTNNEPLQLQHFHGVVPKDVKFDEIQKQIGNPPKEPGAYNLKFFRKKTDQPYECTLCFNWHKNNSRGFNDGIDYLRNLMFDISKIEGRIEKSTGKNILLAVSHPTEDSSFNQHSINTLKISGIIFLTPYVRQNPIFFTRSGICLKDGLKGLEGKLRAKLPSKWTKTL